MLKLQYIRIYLIIIIAINLFMWLVAYSIYVNINHNLANNNLVVLHYNVDFGIDLIGNIKKMFIIPSLSLVIAFVNIALTFLFTQYKHFKLIAHSLLGSCIIISLFLSLALTSIYLV
ncbi:hypothetical protein KJ978_00745, partial [Patescibacteria group bacterium]|nr:hypothetical protein [Patescibacteria group bacterium]